MNRHPSRSPYRLRWTIRLVQVQGLESVEVPLNCWRATFQVPVQFGVGLLFDGFNFDTLFVTPIGFPISSLVLGGAFDEKGRAVYMNETHTVVSSAGGGGVFAIIEEFLDTDSDPNNE